MIIRVIILSFVLLFGSMGCVATLPVLAILGTTGVIANKITDYTLTKRSLDIKEREIKLKEQKFELEKKMDIP